MNEYRAVNLSSVELCVKKICELYTGKEYACEKFPVRLNDKAEMKDYITIISFPVEELQNVIKNVNENNGKKLEEFSIDSRYCHITTFEAKYCSKYTAKFLISFENDGYPVQAKFNDNYDYVADFFKKYISFRNSDSKRLVKEDDYDLDQYYCSMFSCFPDSTKKSKKKQKSVDK